MPPPCPAEFAAIWASEFDRHGVSGALMIASVPGDEESVASAATAFPDRIAGAFMFDPTKPDAESRARRAFDDLGLRVVCLFPAMHHYSMAENEGVRAAASSERPGTAVFVHCGALSVGARNSGCRAFSICAGRTQWKFTGTPRSSQKRNISFRISARGRSERR